jgi:hypothetical protein
MPKVMSPEAIAANRQNAEKSTGPRTAKGKTRASRNALKYGLLAETVVIRSPYSSEEQSDFDSLLADFVAEHQPRGLTEETLVERIATAYWRLRRVQQFETGSVREALEAPDPTQAQIDSLRRQLAQAQEAVAIELELAGMVIKADQPNGDGADDAASKAQPTPAEATKLAKYLIDFARRQPGGPAVRRLAKTIPGFLEDKQKEADDLKAQLAAAEVDEPLRRSRKELVNSLPQDKDLLKLIRYETMLERKFSRALAELDRYRDRKARANSEDENFQSNPFPTENGTPQ